MIKNIDVKRFDSSNDNIFKYVFHFENAIVEAVLYRYETFYKRTVICISVQSGCPVGCTFCGTGKKFIRNLTSEEIVYQVNECFKDMGILDINEKGERVQIMFMSMGEPMLNFDNLETSICILNNKYDNAELLISTIGLKNHNIIDRIIDISNRIDKIGLQFSIHRAFEQERNKLIPFKNKLNLNDIRDFGIRWSILTKRPVYINYCINKDNQSNEELNKLSDLFSPLFFNMTFSVICSDDENLKDKGYKNLNRINEISKIFLNKGYNVRVFNPDGQDDIGGGCGQLWYVQKWLSNKQEEV